MNIQQVQKKAHQLAVEKGWWGDALTEAEVRSLAEKTLCERLILIIDETTEALGEYRQGHALSGIRVDAKGKPEGFPVELADIVIRVFDLSEALGIDLQGAIKLKHEYNKSRLYRHGGKII